MLIRACDGCSSLISFNDEYVRLFLDRQYPGRDICESCDLQMNLAANMAADDCMRNQRPGTALKKLAAVYGLNVKFSDEE
jgi:hypothetical protein